MQNFSNLSKNEINYPNSHLDLSHSEILENDQWPKFIGTLKFDSSNIQFLKKIDKTFKIDTSFDFEFSIDLEESNSNNKNPILFLKNGEMRMISHTGEENRLFRFLKKQQLISLKYFIQQEKKYNFSCLVNVFLEKTFLNLADEHSFNLQKKTNKELLEEKKESLIALFKLLELNVSLSQIRIFKNQFKYDCDYLSVIDVNHPFKDYYSNKPIQHQESRKYENFSIMEQLESNLLNTYTHFNDPNNFKETPTPEQMIIDLIPFQKKALTWFLYREKRIDYTKLFISIENLDFKPIFWNEYALLDNTPLYLNPHSGKISFTFPDYSEVEGGILADEMGLGKTIMMIALMHCNRAPKINSSKEVCIEDYRFSDDEEGVVQKKIKLSELEEKKIIIDPQKNKKSKGVNKKGQRKVKEKKTYHNENEKKESFFEYYGGNLIIVPLSVLDQWKKDMNKFSQPNSFEIFIYHGGNRSKINILGLDVILTTYNTIVKDYSSISDSILYKTKWHRIILDEAHLIRNFKSKQAEACFKLKSEKKWCLSGTPIQNGINDFFSLFKFLKLEILGKREGWLKIMEKKWNANVNISRKTIFEDVISHLLLRRLKSELVDNEVFIPEKEVKVIFVNLNKTERIFYQYIERKSREEFLNLLNQKKLGSTIIAILIQIIYLRMFCGHAKLVLEKSNFRQQLQNECEDFSNFISEQILNKEENINSSSHSKQFMDNCIKNLDKMDFHEECPVCFDKMKTPVFFKCFHIVCYDCSDKIIGSTGSCPICRNPVNKNERKIISKYQILFKFYFYFFPSHEMVKDLINGRSSKLIALINLVNEILARKEKVVIFSYFVKMIELLQIELDHYQIKSEKIVGSTSSSCRSKILQEFSDCSSTSCLLISLMAGSTGLNLSKANHLILVDPWYNPSIENQAMERIHRIGQQKKTFVYKFICMETIEERIVQIQRTKEEKIRELLENEKSGWKLDADDFKNLLGCNSINISNEG